MLEVKACVVSVGKSSPFGRPLALAHRHASLTFFPCPAVSFSFHHFFFAPLPDILSNTMCHTHSVKQFVSPLHCSSFRFVLYLYKAVHIHFIQDFMASRGGHAERLVSLRFMISLWKCQWVESKISACWTD